MFLFREEKNSEAKVEYGSVTSENPNLRLLID